MKRILAVILSAVLMVSGASFTAFADDEKSQQQAVLEKIKDRIGNTDEYENFTSDVYVSEETAIYRFEWESGTKNSSKYMSIRCYENGIITGCSRYDDSKNYYDTKRLTAGEKQQLLLKAQSALKTLNPDLEFTLEPDIYSGNSFSVQRTENGIPVSDNYGYMEIDASTGEISNFYIDYTNDFSFASAEKVISVEDAQQAYKDKIGLKAIYTIDSDYDYDRNKKNVSIEYVPAKENVYINALNGQEMTEEYRYYGFDEAENTAAGEAASETSDTGLSEAEITEFEEIDGLMSQEKLVDTVKSSDLFGIPKDSTITDFSVYKSYNGDYIAHISFNYEDLTSFYVRLNARSGEVLSFYKYGDYEKGKKTSETSTTALADTVLSLLAGSKGSAYKKTGFYSDDYSSSVTYTRYVNGMEFIYDTINVGFDGKGNLTTYSISYTDAAFPSTENLIGEEKAYEILFENADYQLEYIPDYTSKKFVPVYKFESYYVAVDANTGEYLGSVNEGGTNYTDYYSDIEDSYAFEQITELAGMGIGFENKEFKPTENITQQDFIALLYVLNNGYGNFINDDTYDSAYDYAKRYGIINAEETDRTAEITRADAAKYIIRTLSLEEIADLDIYKNSFNDIAEGNGYAEILSGMDIMKGDGYGNFMPESQMKRADAAIVIFNMAVH